MHAPILRALTSLAFAACAINDETGETGQSVTSTNGVSVNGVSVNGVSVNGVSVNGVSVNGVSVNGVSVNGVSVNGVSVNGTTLTGTVDGQPIAASSVGALMTATLSTGDTLVLRIDSASALDTPSGAVWAYGVSYPTDAGWMPLCGSSSIDALQITGTWGDDGSFSPSSTSFTFACRGASVAKCVELGYNPADYTDHMVSCVRLLRGDFCGTGVAYTITGNQVNIYDVLGIQTDTEANWKPEAEWSPDGAVCISADRKTRFYNLGVVPTCVANDSLPAHADCASHGFVDGAMLISEILNPTAIADKLTTKSTLKTSAK